MAGVLDGPDPIVPQKPPVPAASVASAPPAPAAVSYRSFGDAGATRGLLFERVLDEARRIPPVTNKLHTLALEGVDYEDPDRVSIRDQKKAILEGGTLSRRLRGTWVLRDNASGSELDRLKATVARVPYMTDRGTFILNGTEYTLANQMRLRPGVFTRIRDNGEIESHVNVMPGKGPSSRVYLDPETSAFTLKLDQGKLPLVTVLRALGKTDDEMLKEWGRDVFVANAKTDDPKALDKLFDRLVRDKDLPAGLTRSQKVREAFERMELDPEVTRRTLGGDYKNVGADTLLATTRRLIAVNEGRADPDDRDHLAYQTVFGPEDLFAERMRAAPAVLRKVLWKVTARRNLKSIQPDLLSKQLQRAITGSGLGQPTEEVNTADLLDQMTRVSRLGEGGIPCYSADTDVLTERGWKPWPSVTTADRLACLVNGRMEFHAPDRIVATPYTGPMFGGSTESIDYLVTPCHRLWVKPIGSAGTWKFRTASEAHGKSIKVLTACADPWESELSAPVFELAPAPVDKSNRGSAGSEPVRVPMTTWARFLGAYLADGSFSYSSERSEYRIEIGKRASVNPEEADAIRKILADMPFGYRYEQDRRFVVSGKALAHYLSTFGKSADKFVPDYVKYGSVEVRLAFFDVITTHDCSGRSSHSRLYASASERLRDDVAFVALTLGYSVRYSCHQKSGEKTQYKVRIQTVKTASLVRQRERSQHRVEPYSGTVYCATVPGGLLFVRRSGKCHWSGNSIDSVPEEARSVQPSHFGFVDSLRTPECYDAETEVMTYSGWKKWPDVDPQHEVLACLVEGRLEWHAHTALHVHDYAGPMYGVSSALVEYLVTPEHRVRCRPGGWAGSQYRIESAAEAHGRDRKLQCGGHLPYVGDSHNGQFNDWFCVPEPDWKSNHKRVLPAIRAEDWYEFLGWYLGEGNVSIQRDQGRYVTMVSQSLEANPENCRRIEALLARMPFAWHYNRHCKAFVVSGRHLAEYLEQFGYSSDKFLPDDVWEAPVEPRRRLLEALLLGEGRRNRKGARSQFCSTSRRLAEEVQRLAFTLGRSSRISVEADHREERYLDNHIVHLHERQERRVQNTPTSSHHFVRHYVGKVYCASVPGGLLYVRRSGKTGLWSGNSFKVGVDTRLAYMAQKGSDGRVYTPFRNARTGETKMVAPQDLADSVVAFPGELAAASDPNDPASRKKFVAALVKGRLRYVPRKDVDYELPEMEHGFNPLSNLIPLKSTIKGQRVAMGSRMLTQALPLTKPEAPLVQGGVPGSNDQSFEEMYGKNMGALTSDADGTVVSVGPDEIVVRGSDGKDRTHELYNNFPFNRKTYFHQTAAVRPGQQIKAGDLLARSNYTDEKGATALGLNLRTAYIPYKGLNFEDATVISRSAAERLSSEHMYQHDTEWGENVRRGKNAFVSLFAGRYDRKTLDTLDDDGVVQPGTTVEAGAPLVLMANERERSHGQVSRGGKDSSFSDGTLTWDHHAPGVVTDVAKTKKGVVVTVKSVNPMQVGDKLSGRYGDKGVIAAIVDDEDMPQGPDGKPYEVLVNPLGVITRTNPGQMIEAVLGKIAAATGKPYKVRDFKDIGDMVQFAKDELAKNKMSDLEDLVDPETGRKIPKIFTGNRFFMKLHHTSECFDDQTEALTARGWVPWPEVRDDDELATLENGRLVFERPLEFVRQAYDGELCCFEGRYVDYAVTPNHRFYVRGPRATDEFRFDTAARLHGRRFVIPQFGMPHNVDFGCDAGVETVLPVAQGVSMTAGDYAELVGWWVTEGYARVTPRRAYVVLYQSRAANPDKFARIEALANRIGLPWSVYRAGGADMGVAISSRPLAEYLKRHGTHSYNKRLPRELFGHHPETLRRAYDAMMAGDGSVQETATGLNAKYTTVSKRLADDFQELCIRMGLGGVVRKPKHRAVMNISLPDGRNYTSHCRQVWECGVALARTTAQVDGDRNSEGFSRRHYKGVVYCANMRTGLLYVRRNGKPMLSGNSKGQGRGTGGYTSEETPAKGGATGCFAPKQRIRTVDGDIDIARVCEKRLGVHVLCWSADRDEWVYRPVVDWFTFRAKVADLISIRTSDGLVMHCTKNHMVYVARNRKVDAGSLRAGDSLVTWGPEQTIDQTSFMLGSLLGDASVTDTGWTCEHSVKQSAYVAWKQSVLSGLGASVGDRNQRTKLSRIHGKEINSAPSKIVRVGHRHVYEPMRRLCYPDGTKTVTPEWLSRVDGLGVSVWVLDDGSITNRARRAGKVNYSGNIATMGFAPEQRQLLADWLTDRYQAGCTVNVAGALCLSAELCRKLIAEIARHVPWSAIPRSKKFLAARVREAQEAEPTLLRRLDNSSGLTTVPLRIVEVRPYRHDKPDVEEINVYDFTVRECHNYVAGSALVSNSKRVSMMDINAFLSHGAHGLLRDAGAVRGQKHLDWWAAYMNGQTPPEPRVPYVHRKFFAQLTGAGINPISRGGQVRLMALSGKDVDALAGDRIIETGETVDWKGGLKPIKGGLFDPTLTGGHGGNRWAAIKLPEPMPNPVMEEPIRRILGLTSKRFDDVLAGRESFQGRRGPAAIKAALDDVDLDRDIEAARGAVASSRKSTRDAAVKKLAYLKGAKAAGLHPRDWVLDKVPVLPPAFRPVSVMSGNGQPMISDPNYLYKEVIEAAGNLRDMTGMVDDVGEERLALYRAFKGVTGLGDPIQPKNQERQVKGLLKYVFGSSPKFGVVQRKLLGSTVDLVGRAVITPNPDLDMDQVGIPESKAWEIYKPFVVRRLARHGVSPLMAAQMVRDKSDLARKTLTDEMDERPVVITRAPVLHRYGTMAFFPRLVRGETLQVPPTIVKGFAADFDGDAMNYHVPVTDDAVRDAVDKMLPSKNLFSSATFGVHYLPQNEYTGGLYSATRPGDEKKPEQVFRSKADAIRAYRQGRIGANTRVVIVDS